MSAKAVENAGGRNYGIDLLRLVSMFMVVVLHVLGHGGVLQAADGVYYGIAWVLEITCYCAVDCFAIITGYVSYGKGYRISRYAKTWAIACFYSICIAVVAFALWHNIGFGTFLFSMFPVFSRKYWYLTAYTGLFIVMPILNVYTEKVEDSQFRKQFLFVTAAVLLYAPLSQYMFGGGALFVFGGGYSVPWLAYLYLVGIWIRRRPWKKSNPICLMLLLVVIVVVNWLIKVYGSSMVSDIFIQYESPLIVIQAVIWVLLLENIKMDHTTARVVSFLAPSAFSVYLIHDNPIIREELIKNSFSWIAGCQPALEVLYIIGIASAIFCICIAVDIVIRRPAFKVLRVNQKIEQIASKFH